MRFGGVSLDAFSIWSGPMVGPHMWSRMRTPATPQPALADVTGGRAWIAWEYDGRPLPPEHGGPARLIVPHLYFWKSAKWIAGLRLLDHDERASGRGNGYHARGIPGRSSGTSGD
ncbi:hypothetical protein GCM10023238_09120 [Streptomyces heliomycini]